MPILSEHKEILLTQNESKTLPISHNCYFFKNWSHEMAYILGLWYVKGDIDDEGKMNITLHKKDKYILKMVAQELEYNITLDFSQRQKAGLNLYCKAICNDIVAALGLKHKKRIDFSIIPEQFLFDFVRGCFDGVGDIKRIKRNRINVIFRYGDMNFLYDLLAILRSRVGIQQGSMDQAHCVLKLGTRDSILLGNYMYQNEPKLFLLRKKQKFF